MAGSVASQLGSRERVTLVHDYLLVMRGAERTFAAIAELYRDAPIFTLLYDELGTDGRFDGRSITASGLQRLGARQSSFRRLLPLYPWAIARLALPPSDVVLTSSSAFAHGVRIPDGALHICYCYTPFRYAWYEEGRALSETWRVLRPTLRRYLRWVRKWDLNASRSVDHYIAISELSRERIKRYYGRDSVVVYPPVETGRFAPGQPEDPLLLVSELVRHKRPQLALEAARRAKAPIRVVGSGPDHGELEATYPEADFLGRVGDKDLARLYATARAVVVPSVEEFGITAVEAQAAGRPVIAADSGGARETVLDGETGCLVRSDDVEALVQAIPTIDRLDFDPSKAIKNAGRFSLAAFQDRLSAQILALSQQARGSSSGRTSRGTTRAPRQ